MKKMMTLSSVIAWGMLVTGCDRTAVVDRPAAQVVQVAESLASWSNPPMFKTTETAAEREWTVVITENVPAQKSEHYEITFHVVKVDSERSRVTVSADRVNLLGMSPSRMEEPRIARRYMERLATEAMNKQPRESAVPPPSAPAGSSESAR